MRKRKTMHLISQEAKEKKEETEAAQSPLRTCPQLPCNLPLVLTLKNPMTSYQ
jgi:hypothetical protein